VAKEIEYLYGVAPVEAALRAKRRKLVRLWVKAGGKNPRYKEILHLARQVQLPVSEVEGNKLFDLTQNKFHQGLVLETGPLPVLDLEDLLGLTGPGVQLLVALDQIEDPQNLGAIARTAAFLGALGMIRPKTHGAALSPAASKASAGALEQFPLAEVSNLEQSLTRLKKEGYWILGAALDEQALPMNQSLQAERLVLVLGNEGEGIRNLTAKRCDQLLTIPGTGLVESLNVSASAAILIQHLLHP